MSNNLDWAFMRSMAAISIASGMASNPDPYLFSMRIAVDKADDLIRELQKTKEEREKEESQALERLRNSFKHAK